MATITKRLTLQELAQLSEQDQEDYFYKASVEAQKPENIQKQREALNQEIHSLEEQYKMTSEEMRAKVFSGELDETADFSHWLMLLENRECLLL